MKIRPSSRNRVRGNSRWAVFLLVLIFALGIEFGRQQWKRQSQRTPPVEVAEPAPQPHWEPPPEPASAPVMIEGDGEAWKRIVIGQERVARSAERLVHVEPLIAQGQDGRMGGAEQRRRVYFPNRPQHPAGTNHPSPWNPAPPPDSIRIALP